MMEYETIQKWERPDHFAAWTDGAPYDGEWYVYLGRNRDSSTLEESNFQRGLELIGGESETVMIVRESHWAVGWIEWIAIHESDHAALAEADEILAALSDYPVVDEMHYSDYQTDVMIDYWKRIGIRGRMELCDDAGYTVMGARHDDPPELMFDAMHDMEQFV